MVSSTCSPSIGRRVLWTLIWLGIFDSYMFRAVADDADLVHDDNSLLTASEILLKVYDETRGLRWEQNTNWLQNTDVCTWYGVTCYDESVSDQRRIGHIQKLDLSANRLLGTMPQEVFQLPYLETLDIRDNSDISMTFEEIGEAQYLKEISFSNTNVESLDGIEAASQLESLHITSLGLSGTIPSAIYQMTQLKGFFANYNKLQGSISTRIGQLTQLTELYLFDSDLNGTIPTEFGLLANLEVATLAENAFEGTLPTEINQCTKLNTLAINRAPGLEKGPGLTGRLPSLSQLSGLTDLRLQNQLLSGPIPSDFLGTAPRQEVVKVELSRNRLTGTVPLSLTNLKRLNLVLSDNQISSVPNDLCNGSDISGWSDGNVGTLGCDGFLCPPGTTASNGRAMPDEPCESCEGGQYWGSTHCVSSATTTSMGYSEREVLINLYNKMGGRYWNHDDGWLNPAVDICDWYGVECIDGKVTGLLLKNNELSNSPPIELFSLPELKHLDFEDNSIEFPFKGISNAAKLETLLLSRCDLSSLDDVGELRSTSMRKLSLASNYLQDYVPLELFEATSLESLDISHNRFKGVLPSQLGRLTNLQELLFARNSFTGQIPSTIGNLARLTSLVGSDNAFTGTLPPELNLLTMLESLSLHQTNTPQGLSGPLLSFNNLGKLTSLELDSHNLSGSLPEDFLRNTEQGENAVEIRLSDNKLEGDLPQAWAERFQNLLIDLSGNAISGLGSGTCDKSLWNQGTVGSFSCDGILCPPGKFNEFGRQTGPDATCRDCSHKASAQYYGSKTCEDQGNTAVGNPELALLKKFFDSTNGNSWKNNQGWTTSNDPCNGWYGIQCNQNGKVVSIELESNSLQGTPSSSIFQLQDLRSLSLKDNQITFSFEGIEQASSLSVLTLSGNNINSVAGISNATALTELHLTDNKIEGEFPTEILKLTNLKKLYANYNQLSSTIPPDISALKQCEELFLFNNWLTGQIPASIGLLSNLKHLSLAENSFSGTLPPELNDLTNLEILSIQREGGTDDTNIGIDQGKNDDLGAGIRGPLPALNKLKYLKKLYLGSNSLSGSIPYNFLDGVENKEMAIEIDLISNRITGFIPPSLTQFSDLLFYVAGNEISGIADGLCRKDAWMKGAVGDYNCDAILCPPGTYNAFGRQKDDNSICTSCPSGQSAEFFGSFTCLGEEGKQSLSERKVLEDLFWATQGDTWNNKVGWLNDDEIFCDWSGITCVAGKESVSAIHLAGNGLRGTVPTELYELPNLKELNLAQNSVDIIFTGIGSATKLEYLQLDDTGIKSLTGLDRASNLKVFHSVNNNLAGTEVSAVASLTGLESLDLSNNDVGSLPSLAALVNLKHLACAECSLSGPIPSWLTSLTQLEYIDFEGNSLSGPLPSSISNLVNLNLISFADQLSNGGGLNGTLPSFDGITGLLEIHLQMNKFDGSIPQAFLSNVQAEETVTLDLRGNLLTGSVPESLNHIHDMNVYLAGNKIDAIPESICSSSWNSGPGNATSSGSSCGHILCPKGTFNALGRETTNLPCSTCTDTGYALFFGSTECGPAFERDLVYGLFESLGGRSWKHSDGWLEHDDHCSWEGVTCYEGGFRDGFVQTIDLSDNGLKGTLNASIWGLVHLKELDLRKNDIDVSFAGIANAESLETLQLSETKVSTMVGIANAPNLKYLHLTNCAIKGPIPEELYTMTQLRALYTNYNQLSGSLSPQIGQLSQLTEFFIFHNNLVGELPSELGMLTSVEILSFGMNKWTGTLPAELNNLPELRVLSLQREMKPVDPTVVFTIVEIVGLRGELIPFNSTPKLRELYLGSQHLEGDIPYDFLMGIDDTNSTIRVDLSSNMFHGRIPPSLARFDDLRIDLTGNKIRDIPGEFCAKESWFDGSMAAGCDALLCPPGTFNNYGRRIGSEGCEVCNFRGAAVFYGSRMCGALMPEYMSSSYMLQEIYASTGGLSWDKADNWLRQDVSLCEWYGVTCDDQSQVTELNLEGNGLVGLVPSIVFYLRGLRKLNLGGNKVWVKFDDIQYSVLEELVLHETNLGSLDGISNAPSLKRLDVKKTKISTIPEELYSLSNLTALEMSECGLVSQLSSNIGKLSNLKTLLLDRNNLSGTLPPTIGNLKNLEDLFLSDNSFFGTLPSEMEELTTLKSLFLDAYNNNGAGISGPLLSFSSMPKLRSLHLGSNSLTGSIPSNLLAGVDNFDDIVEVDISSNHLTGSIPSQLAAFNNLNFYATNNHIETLDDVLCSKSSWLEGTLGSFSCDALLCPAGTFNSVGRQTSKDTPCKPCQVSDVSIPPYMGQTSCIANAKEREREILELFFIALGGDDWKKKDGWLGEEDYCSWYGIECVDSTVHSISLGSNNLFGIPPPELFELSNLNSLWLYSNPIDFQFQGIEKSSNLENLRLDSTGLKSLDGVEMARSLVEIDVRFNRLKGGLPDLSNLGKLESFSCSANSLSGPLPSFSSNKKLISLRLGENSFSGALPSFENHPAMRTLDLSDNLLSGTMPDNLLAAADISASIFLDLSSNRLIGSVPKSLSRFEDLVLYVRDNQIDDIPAELCSMRDWNQGDVGLSGCDGILCPPNTFAQATGRASRQGSKCVPCDEAVYFGATTCGLHSSATRSAGQLFLGVIAPLLALLCLLH